MEPFSQRERDEAELKAAVAYARFQDRHFIKMKASTLERILELLTADASTKQYKGESLTGKLTSGDALREMQQATALSDEDLAKVRAEDAREWKQS